MSWMPKQKSNVQTALNKLIVFHGFANEEYHIYIYIIHIYIYSWELKLRMRFCFPKFSVEHLE